MMEKKTILFFQNVCRRDVWATNYWLSIRDKENLSVGVLLKKSDSLSQ